MSQAQQIESLLDQGRFYDRLSDAAFADGSVSRGTLYGNLAMKYYSKAERLSIDLDEEE